VDERLGRYYTCQIADGPRQDADSAGAEVFSFLGKEDYK